jgi:hypothetical protein
MEVLPDDREEAAESQQAYDVHVSVRERLGREGAAGIVDVEG